MRLSDLEPVVRDNIACGISTEIISPPGIGKSEFVEDLVKKLSKEDGEEWGFATCFLATMTPNDLMGYMVPTKLEDGTLASVFTTPSWMLTAPTPAHPKGRNINTFKRGIVFLDEFGQGDADTKKAAAQLLLKGEIGPHRLHKGISVIAASNGSADRSGVTKSFDFVINRRMEVRLTPDLPSWLAWAAINNVMPVSMAFAQQNPQIVFAESVPEKQGPWTTPRSLVMADRLLQAKATRNGGVIPSDPASIEAVQGIMGPGAGQYFAFVKLEQEMPSYEDIVKNPDKVKVPQKPDAQMLVCYTLAHHLKMADADPVLKYVERMPKEFAVTFATTACRRQPQLVMHKAFNAWAKENSSLMAAIATPVK